MKRLSRVIMTIAVTTLLITLAVSCATAPKPEQQATTETAVVEQTVTETAKTELAAAPVTPAETATETTATPAPAESTEDKEQPVDTDFHIYVLHTNDTHGRVLEGKYDGMGFAKISTIINMYRDQVDNVLVLDAGDTMHGTTFATLVEGESVVQVMNAIGYDAMVAGNHDFNYGYDRLIELNDMADFPILSANTFDASGKLILPAYKIFEYNGVKVAVFGLTTSECYYKVHPKNIEGLTFADSVEIAQKMVDELSPMADVIIALTHLGIDEASSDTSIRLANEVSGIDLIVDGHSHSTLPEGLKVNDTLIVQAGSYDKNLGAVDIHMKGKEVVDISAQLYSKEQVAERGIEEDPEIAALISGLLEEQDKITSEVIAYTDTVLDGERAHVRTRPTNLSRLITQAMIEATDADCALTNGGGIRASIDVGEITVGEVISVLPFNNTCVVINVTGEELYEAVEQGLKDLPEPSGGYCQPGNITAIYNTFNEPGSRVYKLKINGETVDKNATYKLATNDFTAAGGDGYTVFADKPLQAEVGTLDGVFIEYLKKHYPLP